VDGIIVLGGVEHLVQLAAIQEHASPLPKNRRKAT